MLQPLKEVVKSPEQKDLGKKIEVPLVSKTNIDITQLENNLEFSKVWKMHKTIAKLFFDCGILFNVIKSNHFQWMSTILGHYGLGYVCQTYEKLWTLTLLKEVKIYFQIKEMDVVKESWKET